MSNPNKRKGTAWESAVRDYLNTAYGLVDGSGMLRDPFDPMNVRRAAQEGSRDVGDVHAVPFILECKDVRNPAVPTWLRQAETEARNAGFPYGVVVHKTRGLRVAAGRVHFSVRTWTRVRLALGRTTEEMRARGFTVTVRGLDSGRWYMTLPLDRFAVLLADLRWVVSCRAVR
ncbi:hypothetical protein [Streptomyces uncialis]|uniref:hypothetical protein n=1 Tax=Streptomyces uncialis TaxID=1048205 RepID=UPI00225C40B5|nr:hypothetical protein [Streptomyces uncialis]MCX4663370.1 hypothetical protein [Streptomyces uncialis]